MKRRTVTSVRFGNKRTGAKKMHYIQPCKTLAVQLCKKRAHIISDETGMSSGYLSALDVFPFEFDTQSIDSLECIDSILETMINHSNGRNFVLKNSAHSFKLLFPRFYPSPL